MMGFGILSFEHGVCRALRGGAGGSGLWECWTPGCCEYMNNWGLIGGRRTCRTLGRGRNIVAYILVGTGSDRVCGGHNVSLGSGRDVGDGRGFAVGNQRSEERDHCSMSRLSLGHSHSMFDMVIFNVLAD